ncbi:MAG: tetratricopeptide repeat protein [Terriglobia bacterium]
MSEDDNQVPSALVAVGTKALGVRSEALIKRGLALARSLQRGEPISEPQLTSDQRFVSRFNQMAGLLRQAAAHYGHGCELAFKGDWDRAIAEYHEALRLNPGNDSAHNNLGVALGVKGDLDGAIAEYREALRLNPNRKYSRLNLCCALENKGDLDGAIAEYRTVIRLQPASAWTHYYLGRALELKGDRLAALDAMEKARELAPKDSSIAEAYERIRRKAESHG